jgi:hypothetical protein
VRSTAPDSSRHRRRANSAVASSESGNARRVDARRASRPQATTSFHSRAGIRLDQGAGGSGLTRTRASACLAQAIASNPPRLAPTTARGLGRACKASATCAA